jgi:hypothetical protein
VRTAGLVFVILGSLILGCHSFAYTTQGPMIRAAPSQATTVNGRAAIDVQIVAGITTVTGLILIVSDLKRKEA